MTVYEDEARAAHKVAALMALPDIPPNGEPYNDGERFAPWGLLPGVYGTYSADFDDLAIAVLKDIRDGTWREGDLAARMLREMLCVSGLCAYGTSPRTCFPTTLFKALLPSLITRWERYRELAWGGTA